MKRSALGVGLGLGGVAVVVGGVAVGCVAPSAAPAESGDEGAAASIEEALNYVGCPDDGPVSTYNLAPPHAFPGWCRGPGDVQQAAFDGALAEMDFHCRAYCGQTGPHCAAMARIGPPVCMDRDIGHRWGALCVCR